MNEIIKNIEAAQLKESVPAVSYTHLQAEIERIMPLRRYRLRRNKREIRLSGIPVFAQP